MTTELKLKKLNTLYEYIDVYSFSYNNEPIEYGIGDDSEK